MVGTNLILHSLFASTFVLKQWGGWGGRGGKNFVEVKVFKTTTVFCTDPFPT